MGGFAAAALATALCLALVLVALWCRRQRHAHGVFRRMGVPFVPPHLLYGNNHEFRGSGNQVDAFQKWRKEYGKVYGFFTGRVPTLVISDMDMVREILTREYNVFLNRPDMCVDAEPVISTLVGLRGDRWKEVRSLLTTTFSSAKMKLMTNIINEKVDTFIDVLRVEERSEKVVDCYDKFQGLTLDVICQCALALESNCQRDKDDYLLRSVRGFLKNAINWAITIVFYFPMLGGVLTYASNKLAYSGRMTQIIVSHVEKVMEIRRQKKDFKTVDVLQLMMDASETVMSEAANQKKDSTSSDENNNSLVGSSSANVPTSLHKTSNGIYERLHASVARRDLKLTDKEIVANAWVFLMAGFETTASAMAFTTYLLAEHPEVQEKLHREILKVVPSGAADFLTYEQISEIPYLDHVLTEGMRLFPPIVSFVIRQALRDVNICGVDIPEGMGIMVPIWDVHRDPENWPDPDVFDPERHSPCSPRAARHPLALMTFGAGPRKCIGMRFGLLEAKLALARLVCSFRLSLPPGSPSPPRLCTPTVAINPHPGIPLHLSARKRPHARTIA